MNIKKLVTVFLLFVISVGNGFAQSKRVANRYYEKFAYVKAAKLYEAIYKKGDTSEFVLKRLANSYYNNAQTKEAEVWYKKLVNTYGETNPDYLFKYAQVLRSNNNYKKSDSLLTILAANDKFNDSLDEQLEKEDYLIDYTSNKDKRISVRNLEINTEYSDFGGFLHNGEVYFASATPNIKLKEQKKYKWNEQPFLNIYKADSGVLPIEEFENVVRDSIFVIGKKVILPSVINTKYHESNPIFTKDGKTLYFTRVNYDGKKVGTDKKNTVNLKLFKSQMINGNWQTPKELPFNSDEYSVGHPALNEDENVLYFISDMPGGYGNTDLYKVSVTESGYGTPVNLGKKINTSGKEMFPFIGHDNTLYFSSDGHLGLGLLDIFQTKIKKDNNFSEVVNLGYPFNSKRDDFSFYLNDTGRKGFFSSNRKKGKGDDDIYSFIIYKDIPVCLQTIYGTVRDSRTKNTIPLATVKLVNSKKEVIREVVSDENGAYDFKEIPCGKKSYVVLGSKLDYKPDDEVATASNENGKRIKVDLELTSLIVGNQIVINPIYFDFDKSNIREDAQYELEDVVTVMNNNPNMVIKIESHTDSRGRDEYNRHLSDRRAKSTRDYIISRGVDRNRIESAIGYGESQLLNHCDNKNRYKCSEEEHQLNRRSYFYIVSGGKNIEVQNKKPTVVDDSYKKRYYRASKKSKKETTSKLLKLINNYKKEKAKENDIDKCQKDEECD